MDPGTLTLTPDEMRSLGHRVVEVLVEHHQAMLSGAPILGPGTPTEMERLLGESMPLRGRPPVEVLERVTRDILKKINHVDHPRFMAFIPGPSNFVGAMGAALAAGFNVFAGNWFEGAGAAAAERVTVGWLRDLFGLPSSAGGLFVSGGSAANITALAVARRVLLQDRVGGAVVYLSDQTHASIERGLRVLGFPPESIRRLSSDNEFRLDPREVARAVAADRRSGLRPFCVVASAGTTNTGAVDPLEPLSELCRREGMWLHADGAYGAAAILCEEGRRALSGIHRVDSLSLDPHKWLFQPYESGVVLVRDDSELVRTFRYLPEYLRDVDEGVGEINYCDRGMQLTRGFRALSMWMSIQVFGREGFEKAVARGFHNARRLQEGLEARPGWEIVTPARLGILTFRYHPPGWSDRAVDTLVPALVAGIQRDGAAVLVSTEIRGRPVLRACAINPRTTDRDLEMVVESLDRVATTLVADPQGPASWR